MTGVLGAPVAICSQVYPSPRKTRGLLCAQMVSGPQRRKQKGFSYRFIQERQNPQVAPCLQTGSAGNKHPGGQRTSLWVRGRPRRGDDTNARRASFLYSPNALRVRHHTQRCEVCRCYHLPRCQSHNPEYHHPRLFPLSYLSPPGNLFPRTSLIQPPVCLLTPALLPGLSAGCLRARAVTRATPRLASLRSISHTVARLMMASYF